MKVNYFGIVAAVLAFTSLALAWLNVTGTFTGTVNGVHQSIGMSFTAYLYQIQGTVNGVSSTASLTSLWFALATLALVVTVGVICLVGSFLAGRRGLLLLIVAGVLGLLSVIVFGVGLLNSNFAASNMEPKSVISLFPANAFAPLTPVVIQNALQYSWDFKFFWSFSFGFWVALAASVIAFISAATPSLLAKKPAASPVIEKV